MAISWRFHFPYASTSIIVDVELFVLIFLRVIEVQVFAFSYCSQSYIIFINYMDDEMFAVSKFFYVYFRGGGGVCVF